MKKVFLSTLFCSLLLQLFGQNKTIKAKVVNSQTNEPVVYAAVGLLKADKSISTDENGVFQFENANSEDSLIISCVGYKRATLFVKNIKEVIKLTPLVFELPIVIIKPKAQRVLVLNDFKDRDIAYYQSVGTSKGSLVQMGQYFKKPDSGSWFLSRIKFKQEHIFPIIPKEPNTFRLHFYGLNENELPNEVDLWEPILVKNNGKKHITVDIIDKKWLMPQNGLVITVEWLKIPENLYSVMTTYRESNGKKIEKKRDYHYAPTLAKLEADSNKHETYFLMYSNMKWYDGNKWLKIQRPYHNLAIALTISD